MRPAGAALADRSAAAQISLWLAQPAPLCIPHVARGPHSAGAAPAARCCSHNSTRPTPARVQSRPCQLLTLAPSARWPSAGRRRRFGATEWARSCWPRSPSARRGTRQEAASKGTRASWRGWAQGTGGRGRRRRRVRGRCPGAAEGASLDTYARALGRKVGVRRHPSQNRASG